MYFLYYQKDENKALAAYKTLTHNLRKCVIELPIFNYLSLLTSLVQKLWERFKRLPSPTFPETSSQLLFISPSCKYCIKAFQENLLYHWFCKHAKLLWDTIPTNCELPTVLVLASDICFNYFVLIVCKTESTVWCIPYSATQTYRNNAFYWIFSPFCIILENACSFILTIPSVLDLCLSLQPFSQHCLELVQEGLSL